MCIVIKFFFLFESTKGKKLQSIKGITFEISYQIFLDIMSARCKCSQYHRVVQTCRQSQISDKRTLGNLERGVGSIQTITITLMGYSVSTYVHT